MKEPERLPKKKALEELKDWIPEIANHDLSLKQMRFLVAYIGNNFNATEAYYACNSAPRTEGPNEGGCCPNTAGKRGCGMLKHSKIQAALADYMKAFIGENKDKLEYRILNQLVLFAFYDPFDLITATGNLRKLEEIPEDHRQLILGIETQMHPKDPTITTTKVKLADRKAARQELEKYMSLLTDKTTTTLKLEDGVRDKLQKFLGSKEGSGIAAVPKKYQTLIKNTED